MSSVRCPSCGAPVAAGRFCGTCGMRLSTPAPPATLVLPSVPVGTAPLVPGTILAGRYRIVTALASGAMGAVYKAEDLRLGGRLRALKEMLQNWGTPEDRAEAESWFRREGDTLKDLQHPAIPLVHDTFGEGQRHYLVMDLVEGRSLEQVLAEEGRPGLPEASVVPWAEQVLDVLSYLHGRPDPLIFRDLKPANLMLTPQGTVRLIDFGIARVFTRQAQGTAIGTPGYAPPEQYQGLAEPASDLYALGATMHHLLSGRDPRKHRPFDFPPVRSLAPDVSIPVATAIDRSLALDPRARPGTAAEMRKALRATTLEIMPKLSLSGSLARSGSGTMPGLNRAGAPATVDPTTGSLVQVGPKALKLYPDEVRIAFSGNRVLTGMDHRTLRIKNKTNKRLLCTFDATVPWLRPDPPAAWLEPWGKLEVGINVALTNPAPGLHLGGFGVHAGNQTWSTPVRLRVRPPVGYVRRGVLVPLSGIASLCFSVGVVAMVLGALGVHIFAGQTAWNLLVAGLVGRVVLGIARAGKRP